MRSQPLDDLKVFLETCSEPSPMTLVLRLFLHSCFCIALPFSATHHSMYITYNSLFIPLSNNDYEIYHFMDIRALMDFCGY